MSWPRESNSTSTKAIILSLACTWLVKAKATRSIGFITRGSLRVLLVLEVWVEFVDPFLEDSK